MTLADDIEAMAPGSLLKFSDYPPTDRTLDRSVVLPPGTTIVGQRDGDTWVERSPDGPTVEGAVLRLHGGFALPPTIIRGRVCAPIAPTYDIEAMVLGTETPLREAIDAVEKLVKRARRKERRRQQARRRSLVQAISMAITMADTLIASIPVEQQDNARAEVADDLAMFRQILTEELPDTFKECIPIACPDA